MSEVLHAASERALNQIMISCLLMLAASQHTAGADIPPVTEAVGLVERIPAPIRSCVRPWAPR